MSGYNTYTGSTTVNGGTLQASTPNDPGIGALGNSSHLTINAGATVYVGAENAIGYAAVIPVTINAGGLMTTANNVACQMVFGTTLTLAGGTLASGTPDPYGASWVIDGNVNVPAGSGTSALSATNVVLNNSGGVTFNVGAGATLNVSGNFANSNGADNALVKTGSGTMVLSASNTYSGGTTIGGGTLNINADAALGAVPASPTTNLTFSGNGTLQAGAAAVSLNANRNVTINGGVTATFDTQGNTMTVSGSICGAGSLSKIGSGELQLWGSNTYQGTTTINIGTLSLGSTGSLGDTAITVVNGASFWVRGVNVAGTSGSGSAGATLNLSPGAVFGIGNGQVLATFDLNQQSGFTGTALTLGGGTLNFELNNSGADSLVVNHGAAAISGTNTINFNSLGSSLTPGGNYPIISAPSGLNGGFAFASGGTAETLTVSGTAYKLTLNSSGTAETVHVYGSTSYSLSAAVANPVIITGGSTTVSSVLQNTGTLNINVPLDYAGLSVVASGGSVSPLSQSGSGVNPASSSSGTCSFTSSVLGTATLTPSCGTVTNDTIGGTPSGGSATAATVTVWDHSNASLLSYTNSTMQTINFGNCWLRGATVPSQTFTIYNRAANTSTADTAPSS